MARLVIQVSPSPVFAGTPVLDVTVEAQDAAGQRVPDYRGTVTFNSTSTVEGLPRGGLRGTRYTFTAADAGRHQWSGVTLNTAGDHTITVQDGTRQATSDPITVRDVLFQVSLDPETSYLHDPTLQLTITAVDTDGHRVTGYQGAIDLQPSVPMRGLPQPTRYTFTPADAGQRVFPDLAFTALGDHQITVTDRAHPARQHPSNLVTTRLPPEPTPIPAQPAPNGVTLPDDLPAQVPPPLPLGWGMPYQATSAYETSNTWRGYPDHAVPASPGTRYIVSGAVLRNPDAWWPTFFYGCPYLGWEPVLTAARERGSVVGYPPSEDPTFFEIGLIGCSDWSGEIQGASVAFMEPKLSKPAPLGTQGTHMNVAAGGNSSVLSGGNSAGTFTFVAGPADASRECDATAPPVAVADPIDTRSGDFFLHERDLGIATGCADVDLVLERTYSRLNPSDGVLGPGWVHSYEQRIIPSGSAVIVQRPRGSFQVFHDVGGAVYAGAAGSPQTLMKRDNGGWVLVHRDRRVDLFDAAGRLEAQQDANGNQIWLTYETYDYRGMTGTRLARVDAPGGRFLWLGYDYYRPNRLIMVGDQTGRTVRYGYDDAEPYDFVNTGRLSSVTDPTGAVDTYTYAEASWLLTSQTDALGNTVFTNTYDVNGRVTQQVNHTGLNVTLSYQVITDTAQIVERVGTTEAAHLSALLVTTATDQQGTVTYTYGSDGLLRLMTDPVGATTRYRGYTDTRQATEIEDALGTITRIAYNDLGLPVTITDPLGNQTQFAYDAWGQLTEVTDALGRTSIMAYDGPRISSIADPSGNRTQFQYGEESGWQNMLRAISYADSFTTTLSYDAAGDVTAINDALGRTTTLLYDNAGRFAHMTDPQGMVTTLAYDAADRLIQTTQTADGDERITVYQYDAVGNLTSVTDPLSRTTTFGYDAAGRRLTQTLADGQTLSFSYDTHRNLTALTPPERDAHRFRYTPINLLDQYAPPTLPSGATFTSYSYNLPGQLTQVTRPDGSLISFAYDQIGRTETITHTGGVTHLTYDAVSGDVRSVQAPDATVTYQYDALSRPIRQTWSDGISGTVTHSYHAQAQLAREQVNTLPAIPFTYDASGALIAAGALTLDYTASGLLDGTTIERIADAWVYSGFSEPISYHATVSDTTALAFQYQRDAIGRITSQSETIAGVTTTYSYTYDLAGQLVEVWQNGTSIAQYTYDSNGNRLSVSGPHGAISASYNAQDQLLQYGATSYGYTPNGERASATTGGQTTSYRYDAFGNLEGVSLPDGTQIGYLIDGVGRRIGTQVNGTLVQGFLYADALRPVAELDSNGAVVSQFVYATRLNVPDYLVKDGRRYRIISDHRGSVRLVVDTATGQVAQRLDYDAWGGIIQDTHPGFQPFGFAGGLYDQHTGLTHFGAREYDAETGRWLQKDPIGFAGGDANVYAYVGNDPVNRIDPSGNIWLPAVTALIGLGASVAGNILGQMAANGWRWECLRPMDIAIAAGTGLLAGALAPRFATGFLGSVGLGAAANVLQYVATQVANGASLSDPVGWAWAIGTGGIGGAIGGVITRGSFRQGDPFARPGVRFDPNSAYMNPAPRASAKQFFGGRDRRWRSESWRINNDLDKAANTGASNIARTFAGYGFSGWPMGPNNSCDCSQP